MAKIIIADDHHVVRMGIKFILSQHGHEVVGEMSSGVEVVTAIQSLKADLIILDIDLPGMDGFEVLRRLSAHKFQAKVLVFSAMPTEGYSIRCSRLGAVGYVSKMEELTGLLNAINMVMKGYTLFPVTNNSRVDRVGELETEHELIGSLSDRELVVLRYLSRGYRVNQISQALKLSDKTVSTYKARLLKKLSFDNIADLINFARFNKIN